VVLHAAPGVDGFFNVSQQRVTGTVTLKLWKGTHTAISRKSPFSLYRADLASFTMGRYNPKGTLKDSSIFSPCRSPFALKRKPKAVIPAQYFRARSS
jgi:argininosuccinate synthase